ncbi:MAG: ABC transporter ATP-binding protein [Pseudomonadota bacterium]
MDGATLHSAKQSAVSPGLSVSGGIRFDGASVFGPLRLHAEAGRWTAILGRSGSGKSSLLRAIAGLLRAPEFTGEVAASDNAPLDGRVSWMAQSDLLLPWASARENAALGPRLRDRAVDWRDADAALEAVGLGGRGAALPQELSGGQRQRVALARTLVEDRPVVLLDEPFSALDAATREELQELFWTRLAGRTVVLVTHDPLEAARLAHRLMILGDGQMSEIEVAGAPLRATDAPETLQTAARLTRLLRETRA